MALLTPSETITIRPAYGDDDAALVRLAALDSAPGVPAGPMLLAEVDEQVRAALSLTDLSVIADPFFPTRALVALLRTHAAALAAVPAGRGRSRLRARIPRTFVLSG
jgi:hypothetical protein